MALFISARCHPLSIVDGRGSAYISLADLGKALQSTARNLFCPPSLKWSFTMPGSCMAGDCPYGPQARRCAITKIAIGQCPVYLVDRKSCHCYSALRQYHCDIVFKGSLSRSIPRSSGFHDGHPCAYSMGRPARWDQNSWSALLIAMLYQPMPAWQHMGHPCMCPTMRLMRPSPAEQRHSVKMTAMQPLSAVLADVCAKFKPALDPSAVAALTLNKKQVGAHAA
jgi:hypothetical protein